MRALREGCNMLPLCEINTSCAAVLTKISIAPQVYYPSHLFSISSEHSLNQASQKTRINQVIQFEHTCPSHQQQLTSGMRDLTRSDNTAPSTVGGC